MTKKDPAKTKLKPKPVYISGNLHKQVRIAAAERVMSIRELVSVALSTYLYPYGKREG